MVPENVKLCECGCGKPTGIAARSRSKYGVVAGEPRRFLQYHHLNVRNRMKGEANPLWKGGIKMHNGRVTLYDTAPGYVGPTQYEYEHRLVVEKILGKRLPARAVVHHVDEDRRNNYPDNLVVCENDSYHRLLHMRSRAYKACGDANFRKCVLCKQYDNTDNMRYQKSRSYVHDKCKTDYDRIRRQTKENP